MLKKARKYAKAIIAAIGTAASVATALGYSHEKYVSIAIAVLTVLGVYQAPKEESPEK